MRDHYVITQTKYLHTYPFGPYGGAPTLNSETPAFRTANDHRLGLDFKAVLRDALTLDATANPDFSQVESDEPQVTINERFETFYPENRPFFFENAGCCQTPASLFFYSPTPAPG